MTDTKVTEHISVQPPAALDSLDDSNADHAPSNRWAGRISTPSIPELSACVQPERPSSVHRTSPHSRPSSAYNSFRDPYMAGHIPQIALHSSASLSQSSSFSSLPPSPQSPSKEHSEPRPQAANDHVPDPLFKPAFSFPSQSYVSAPLAVPGGPQKPSQRRGHRYKHSSVSMNFFMEPPPRAPMPIPASLPIPSYKECVQSMSTEQKIRLGWGVFHVLVAALIWASHTPFASVSALAHVLLYDSLGALVSVAVDVLSNFEVWKQSSLRHPFSLARVEVLAEFALSVTLLFMGGDILSHSVQEVAQAFYEDSLPSNALDLQPQHQHGHSHRHNKDYSLHWNSLYAKVALALVATAVSAVRLDHHSPLNRTLRRKSRLPQLLSDPAHRIAIIFSVLILSFRLVDKSWLTLLDSILTPCLALSTCYIGWELSKALGGMLVMSFSGKDNIAELAVSLQRLPHVLSVSDISFWQVHHELWMACLRIVMTGHEDDERTVRLEADKIVRSTMGDDIVSWETTIDIARVS